ncbi:hypothetical protein [Raineya sp.]
MARTQVEIEQEILQAKASETELSSLNSVSQTAIWRVWVRLTAFIVKIFEQLFDSFSAEIDTRIAQNRAGTLAWYVQKAKEFQNGDTLNPMGEYDTINEAKRIITRCAVREVVGGVSIKIAKAEPPVQLSATELQSFTQYINKVKFAGVGVSVVNLPAEAVLVNIQVLYTLIGEEDAKSNVKQAISEYIESISFDGEFVLNDMIAFCRAKQGIVDVLVNSVTINANLVTGGRYTAISGYYSFDGDDVANNYVMTNV